jgi:hypothetical protein
VANTRPFAGGLAQRRIGKRREPAALKKGPLIGQDITARQKLSIEALGTEAPGVAEAATVGKNRELDDDTSRPGEIRIVAVEGVSATQLQIAPGGAAEPMPLADRERCRGERRFTVGPFLRFKPVHRLPP